MILDDPTTTTTEYHAAMPLARLVPHPHNPRHLTDDDQALQELADSIRAQGVIEPVIVIPDPDDQTLTGEPARFLIVAGHRRARASEIAEQTTIPAIIRHDLTDPAEVEMWMLVENGQRADLDPIAEARAIQRLVTEHKLAQRTLCRELGRSQSHISKRLALLKLPEPLQAAVLDGRLGVELAARAAALPKPVLAQLNDHACTHPDSVARSVAARIEDEGKASSGNQPSLNRASDVEGRATIIVADANDTLYLVETRHLTLYVDDSQDDDVSDSPRITDTADPTLTDAAIAAGRATKYTSDEIETGLVELAKAGVAVDDLPDTAPWDDTSADDYELVMNPPWHNYDRSAADPCRVIAKFDDLARVRHVLIYERAHRNRDTVIDAATQRLAELTSA